MMLYELTSVFIRRAEKRLGVVLDYTHHIARTDLKLLLRYNKLFGFLDPVRHVPVDAYHVARVRAAVLTDCGTCVQAEVNLARAAGLSSDVLRNILSAKYEGLPKEVRAVALMTDAVVGRREDDPENRDVSKKHFGDAGLIELSFAMHGAAALPGIKRTLGYSVSCNMEIVKRTL
jgi:AhpD family alkylhydroperoxidase